MDWFDRTITWFFPRLMVKGTPWEKEWARIERQGVVLVCRVVFPIVAAAYVAHYFFYDRPMGLEPLEQWFRFRFGVALAAVVIFLLYLKPIDSIRYYRVPAMVGIWFLCLSQAYLMKWYGHETWIIGFILVIAGTASLRLTALESIGFALLCIGGQSIIYSETTLATSDIVSGSIISLGVIVLLRASYRSDVESFLLDKRNIEAERRISELNQALAERVRAFIPRVIAERMDNAIANEGSSVVAASVTAMEPRVCPVACLFSDIRGYTKSSSDLKSFLNDSVMPEVRRCSDAVEEFGGIPRKIGDLILAYFDDEDDQQNIVSCVASALSIARLNRDMNETASSAFIRRFILLSFGDAVVGNVGGLDSSIEITALGPPVNFLSRLDDLTKAPKLAEILENGDVVISAEVRDALTHLDGLELITIDLRELELVVRDFPEVRWVYRLPPSDSNYAIITAAYENFRRGDSGRRIAASVGT